MTEIRGSNWRHPDFEAEALPLELIDRRRPRAHHETISV